jgi:hypothetical protein
MKAGLNALGAALALFLVSPASAQIERQLGPHEHGHGKLNIAIEDARVMMELEAPGDDIVGFEHPPSTGEEKAVLDAAQTTLKNVLTVFEPNKSAGCRVTEVKIDIAAEDHDEDEADHAEHQKENQAKEPEHHHSEVHANYTLECAPGKLSSLRFAYFKLFPRARMLSVAMITPKGQTSYEITKDNADLSFGEMM